MRKQLLEEIDRRINKYKACIDEVWEFSDDADYYHAFIEELQTLKNYINNL